MLGRERDRDHRQQRRDQKQHRRINAKGADPAGLIVAHGGSFWLEATGNGSEQPIEPDDPRQDPDQADDQHQQHRRQRRAEAFERIHRSNLIGMGILPLRLPAGTTPQSLALTVADRVGITLDPSRLEPRGPVRVAIHRASGRVEAFEASRHRDEP
ncbi:hypothetical protein [Paracoccus sp. FO-3]|uniref:hypothetical protein n=1 Tax=Paracoccus sp. FO-3 TaxID=1335059 RepID=UPI001126A84F|nr:hypothetical protein [Paracoccus sp. FO-3]